MNKEGEVNDKQKLGRKRPEITQCPRCALKLPDTWVGIEWCVIELDGVLKPEFGECGFFERRKK